MRALAEILEDEQASPALKRRTAIAILDRVGLGSYSTHDLAPPPPVPKSKGEPDLRNLTKEQLQILEEIMRAAESVGDPWAGIRD